MRSAFAKTVLTVAILGLGVFVFTADALFDDAAIPALARALTLGALVHALRRDLREDMGWAWPLMACLLTLGAAYYLYVAASSLLS